MITQLQNAGTWRRGWLAALLVLSICASSLIQTGHVAIAQDGTNLLSNGSLENPYYGQGAATRTAPAGWNIWVGAGAPEAFPHNDKVQVIDGEVSWNVKQGYTAFTAAGYQQVSGLTQGDVLQASAYGWVYTCNDTTTSCIIADPPYRRSDTSAGASLKVGIDPTGGTDPLSANVVWSAPASPYDQWIEMSAIATAQGDTVTVFLYMTQTAGLALNNVYWDKASLVRTTEAPETPVQVEAPFVVPQNVRPDGSIVHIVQAGDTLSSIAYAYSEYRVTIESIVALNDGLKPNTRFLQIGQEIIILPPGSVDPVTGQLSSQGGATGPTTGVATPIPTPTPASLNAQPVQSTPAPVVQGSETAIYQPVRAAFIMCEHGVMFWLEDSNQVFVLVDGSSDTEGTFSLYQNTWREGMPETDPNLQAPAGLVQPDRIFGQAWRTYPGVKDNLGWGTAAAQNFTALVVRDQGNVTVSAPDNRVYKLDVGGTWAAVDYYAQP